MYIRPNELMPVTDFLRDRVEVETLIELLDRYLAIYLERSFDHAEDPELYIDATTYLEKVRDFREMLQVEYLPKKP